MRPRPYKPPQSNSVGSKSRFSPPPSTLGKRYATALPSLAGLGRASSGTGCPCRGHRIAPNLAHLVPFVGSSMRLGRVSSRVCGLLLVEGVSIRRQAALRRTRLGTLLSALSSLLPSLCHSGLRCDCGGEPHRSTGCGLGRPVKPHLGFSGKRTFVGASFNGGRGFVTSSPSAPWLPIGRWL